MPWQETCAVEERERFVIEVVSRRMRMAEACRAYGVSRRIGYKWIKRFKTRGLEGLKDASRAPLRHPNQVSDLVAERFTLLRGTYPNWGPKKLVELYSKEYGSETCPAESTVGEVLRRAGLTVPRRRRQRYPAYTQPYAEVTGPNALWAMDFKGWFRLGDGTKCHPLNVVDCFSRFFIRYQALRGEATELVKPVLEVAFREFGLPWAMRTDNGPPFASRSLGGLTELAIWFVKLGIRPERIVPGHPEENSIVERANRTTDDEGANLSCGNLRGQQRRFDRFRWMANEQRPHEALGQRTPASVYTASPRQYAQRVPKVEYPAGFTVRMVRGTGEMKWGSDLVFVSERLVGEPVGLVRDDDRYWDLYFGMLRIGMLDSWKKKVTHDSTWRRNW